MNNIKTHTKLIISLVTGLILSILLITSKNALSPYLMHEASYGMPALIERGEVKNLFIGSSMFRQGLDISVLDSCLDESDYYILSYNGNTPMMELFELEYLLESGLSIENLYLDMYAFTLFDDQGLQDEKIYLELPSHKSYALWLGNSKEQSLSSLWRSLCTANNEMIINWPISSKIANSRFRNGGNLNHVAGSNSVILKKMSIPTIEKNMLDEQASAIDKIVSLCRTNGINITFIETPKYYLVSNDSNYIQAMNIYKNYLSSKGIPYFTSSEYSFDNHNSDYYSDLIHLSTNGRIAFTNCLQTIFTN